VIRLCCYAAANFAYYRAGWRNGNLVRSSQFWVAVNGNFLDMGVLEWCKLYTDKKGHHFWGKIVGDRAAFEAKLYVQLGLTPDRFEEVCRVMRTYRDRFVAHLDSELIAHTPHLDLAIESTLYYHSHIIRTELPPASVPDLPSDLRAYYEKCSTEASEIYV
jgi:hypothetical protein